MDEKVKKDRSNKSDIVLLSNHSHSYSYMQIKGITFNACKLQSKDSIIDIETQLSRGRVNDHPTQSRLYLKTDFDYLILSMDPCYTKLFSQEVGMIPFFTWQFYAIPTNHLRCHDRFPNRLCSHQRIKYLDLQDNIINKTWIDKWFKIT